MHHGLTKFKNGVVANFVTVKKSDKVLFILDGLPGGSDKNQVTEAFAKKGYFVIHPRYKGTWASQGRFLNHSPAKDILNLLPLLPLGFVDYWSGKKFRIRPKKIYVVGASFGGMVSLISALDRRITKVVAFSPVISWTAETKQEPLSRL